MLNDEFFSEVFSSWRVMHIFRRSLGMIPFLIGAIGLIACVVLAIGLWIAGQRIDRMNQMLFAQSDHLFEIGDRQMQRASQGLSDTNDMLLAAELGLAQDFDEAMVRDFLAKPEVKSLEVKLRNTISEIESLIHLIETSEEMMRQGKETLNFSLDKNQSVAGTFLETLGKTRIALLRLLRVVSDAEACWMSLNQGQELVNNARNLLRMNALIQKQLEDVSLIVSEMRDKFAKEREAWQDVGRASSRYIELGQYLGVGLFVWIGLGQYALTLCGIMRLRFRACQATSKDLPIRQ
jgi:hypothetical protein